MNNSNIKKVLGFNKGSVATLLILVVVIIILIIGAYLFGKGGFNLMPVQYENPSPTPLVTSDNSNSVIVTNTPAPQGQSNATDVPVSTLPGATNSPVVTNVGWKLYSNPELGFQAVLPPLSKTVISKIPYGRVVTITIPPNTKGLGEFVPEITVQINNKYNQNGTSIPSKCETTSADYPSKTISINGISFNKSDISKTYKVGAIAAAYCVINKNLTYSIVPVIYTSGLNDYDSVLMYNAFDQVIKSINFSFLDQPAGLPEAWNP